jgi:hypothetical protein
MASRSACGVSVVEQAPKTIAPENSCSCQDRCHAGADIRVGSGGAASKLFAFLQKDIEARTSTVGAKSAQPGGQRRSDLQGQQRDIIQPPVTSVRHVGDLTISTNTVRIAALGQHHGSRRSLLTHESSSRRSTEIQPNQGDAQLCVSFWRAFAPAAENGLDGRRTGPVVISRQRRSFSALIGES